MSIGSAVGKDVVGKKEGRAVGITEGVAVGTTEGLLVGIGVGMVMRCHDNSLLTWPRKMGGKKCKKKV